MHMTITSQQKTQFLFVTGFHLTLEDNDGVEISPDLNVKGTHSFISCSGHPSILLCIKTLEFDVVPHST